VDNSARNAARDEQKVRARSEPGGTMSSLRTRLLTATLTLRIEAVASGMRLAQGLGERIVHKLPLGLAALLIAALPSSPAEAQLRGHGGPVRAIAISPDGKHAVSGSFDSSAIYWSLARDVAEQVLRFHDSAVNAVAIARDGRIVTAGEDARIAVWQPGAQSPDRLFEHLA
jgi:WD40 repeat protein